MKFKNDLKFDFKNGGNCSILIGDLNPEGDSKQKKISHFDALLAAVIYCH